MAQPATALTVRRVRDDADFEAAARLDREFSPVLHSAARLRELCATGGTVLLGFEAGRAVGAAMLGRALDEGTVFNLVVASSACGRGHGRGLLRALLDAARAAGLRRVLLEVRAGNSAAIALYAAAGFGVDGRRRGYYPQRDGLPAEDAILMSLPLEEHGARTGD